jgi:hypothetical protein
VPPTYGVFYVRQPTDIQGSAVGRTPPQLPSGPLPVHVRPLHDGAPSQDRVLCTNLKPVRHKEVVCISRPPIIHIFRRESQP